ncbi:MAG: hypothetical protein RSE23_01725 [Clostridia bacterium]
MKTCERLLDEQRQLAMLQMAYREHLHARERARLSWLEKQIDKQQKAVLAYTQLWEETHPTGCQGCVRRGGCPIYNQSERAKT